MQPKLTPEQHAEQRGTCCPNCGANHDLDYEAYDFDDQTGSQNACCRACDATWTDTYKFSHYEALTTDTGTRPGVLHASETLLAQEDKCPSCNGNASRGDSEILDGAIHVGYICDDCDAEYWAVLTLTGYQDLQAHPPPGDQ